MRALVHVGLVAPCSPVPAVELELGIRKLHAAGAKVVLPKNHRKSWMFYAGDDEARAQAFFDFAHRDDLSVLWSMRGGYGANRLLPVLDQLTEARGVPPKKLLVGYSDVTTLIEYVRSRWGWATLHGPMPALKTFSILPEHEWQATENWIRGFPSDLPFQKKLKFIGPAPTTPIKAELVGGNLAVWGSLIGTPYMPDARGKILFFEEVSENLGRVDRAMHQLYQSGGLEGVKAIVLGDFLDCHDPVPSVLKPSVLSKKSKSVKAGVLKSPKPAQLMPLRKQQSQAKVLQEIFGYFAQRLSIPVATGFPAGHGPGFCPLPLGASYRLSPDGRITLENWDWTGSKRA